MIDDVALLTRAIEQMDAEDPAVAQAAKDRAAQTLSEANLNFSKLAELIERRRLLLRPGIVAGIKRMDQPGILGDAAFRDTGTALRKEGQSFRQIAQAIELSDRPAPAYADPVQASEPVHEMPREPGPPAWLEALFVVGRIVFFPLLHPIRFLAIALVLIVLFYAFRGVVALGQHVTVNFAGAGVAAARRTADDVKSSVNSFIHKYILRPSNEAAPPTPASPVASPAAPSPSPTPSPSATPSPAPAAAAPAPPATASAPSANAPAPPPSTAAAPQPLATPAPRSPVPASPRVSMPRHDARGEPPSRWPASHRLARLDRYPPPCCCEPFEDDPPRVEDDPARASADLIPEGAPRNSRIVGPCIGGVGGCAWGGNQY